MDTAEEIAKAKEAEAAIVADATGLKKIWLASKPAVITVAVVFLFIGFALGRASAHF